MKVLYSILSLVCALFILRGYGAIDLVISKDAVAMGLEIIGKTEWINLLNFKQILLIISLAFLCGFVIIYLLYIKNGKKYILSSLMASSISVIFFTLYISSFNIVKNFYVASKEFSDSVKLVFNRIFTFNILSSFAVILIILIYFICKLIRRNKNEKEF